MISKFPCTDTEIIFFKKRLSLFKFYREASSGGKK